MKNYILKNARVIDPGRNIDSVGDIGVCGKLIEEPAKLKDPEVIDLKGKVLYQAPEPKLQAIVAEHKFLIDSIRSGKPQNRLRPLVNSTLLAIAGRESAYSGKKFKYDWFLAKSGGTLYKEEKFGKIGLREIPVPGKTQIL